jgi:hypothetical protein
MTGPTILPKVPIPLCPHCGEELAGMGLYMWQVPGWLIVSSYCPGCHVTLSTQTVPIPTEEPADPSRIQRPS